MAKRKSCYVVAVNNRSGKRTRVTKGLLTSREANTVASRFSFNPHRHIRVVCGG